MRTPIRKIIAHSIKHYQSKRESNMPPTYGSINANIGNRTTLDARINRDVVTDKVKKQLKLFFYQDEVTFEMMLGTVLVQMQPFAYVSLKFP